MPLFKNDERGITQHYTLFGEGPEKVVFIMGLFGIGENWELQTEYIKDSKEFQAVTFDNRGCGKSSRTGGRCTTQMMAQDIYSLLINELRWEKFNVVGVSMGGMISQELCLIAKEKISSVTLMSTHAGGITNFLPPSIGLYFFLRSFVIGKDTEKLVENAIELLYGDEFKTKSDDKQTEIREFHTRMVELRKSMPMSLSDCYSHVSAVQTHSVPPERLSLIKELKCKKFVITGDDDRLVRHENSKYLAEQIDAHFVNVPGHGHCLQNSYKEEVHNLLKDVWLGQGVFSS